MTIKEYLKTKKILTDSQQSAFSSFITTDGQSTINNNFKYKYGNREIVEEYEEDIENLVTYILTKNEIEYSKLYSQITAIINAEKVISKETNSGKDTRNNTGKQITSTDFGKIETTEPKEERTTRTPADFTVTRTPAEERTTTTPAETTQTKTPSGMTQAESGTETDTQTTETKPFDSNTFSETEKVTSVSTPTNKQTVTTYQGNEVTKQETDAAETVLNEVIHNEVTVNETDEPETIVNEVIKNQKITNSGTDETTRQDLLKEENLFGHIIDREETNPAEVIQNYEKLRIFYSLNLWDRITEDILNFICLRTWNTGYSFL